MERRGPDIRAVALALARRIAAECRPDSSPGRGAAIDERRAAELLTDLITALVADAVAQEREECAQIAETMEPERAVTIAEVIRARGLKG